MSTSKGQSKSKAEAETGTVVSGIVTDGVLEPTALSPAFEERVYEHTFNAALIEDMGLEVEREAEAEAEVGLPVEPGTAAGLLEAPVEVGFDDFYVQLSGEQPTDAGEDGVGMPIDFQLVCPSDNCEGVCRSWQDGEWQDRFDVEEQASTFYGKPQVCCQTCGGWSDRSACYIVIL